VRLRRTTTRRTFPILLAALTAAAPGLLSAGALQVTGHQPGMNAGNVAPTSAITVEFSAPVNAGSVTASTFRAYGRQSGPVSGAFTLLAGGQAVRLRPSRPFKPGETVWVNLAEGITANDASPLRTGGYAYQFSIAATGSGETTFSDIDTLSVVLTGESNTRLYGAQATDLDLDGWLDLATMNEDTQDIRVLMNLADGTGEFTPVLQPPRGVGSQASPNEPGDFDNDGFPDVAVANGGEGTVSVVLGNGNGTFSPEQVISVGGGPHGIAVLDVDGDADLDFVASAFNAGHLALSLNDGAGSFGTMSPFNSAPNGWEWTIASGDMDEDGIVDLVVGNWDPNEIRILKGNGNGGFGFLSSKASAGSAWMIAVGDLDGDRHLDVAVANSSSGNGARLLGNGAGQLGDAATVPIQSGAISTDIGDLDGDGDLDWILASFVSRRWDFFVNDGAGNFTFDQRYIAPEAGSCALPFDLDNDGDLDVALFDELADTIRLIENSAAGQLLFLDRFEQEDLTAWSATGN
jgi:hypothetical protein